MYPRSRQSWRWPTPAGNFNVASLGGKMKILLWIVVIIFLIGLLVVSGVLSLIF